MPFASKKQEGYLLTKRCDYCGEGFEVYRCRLKRPGRGRFCSQVCASRGTVDQRKRFKSDTKDYRTKALRAYGAACQKCGYDRFPKLLWVHHKDFGRTNHDLSNLEVLCIRCHLELHEGAQYAFC